MLGQNLGNDHVVSKIAGELEHDLQSWRYAPSINPAGVQSAACFPVSFRVVLKG